jgi:hypothetical protein
MRFTFRLRTLFVLATLIAVGLFLWGERQRFLREHVYVQVVDATTGAQLTHFRYRTWIITQSSGPDPEWSEWIENQSDTPLSLKVPQHCRLILQSLDSANPVGESWQSYDSMLVAPESSHQWTIRLNTQIKETSPDEESWYSKVDFKSGPCILSGRVVDEQGNPVRKFGLRVYLQHHYQDSYLFEIDDPDGRFNLKCPQPIAGYIVQAEQYALEQRGLLERTELTILETANQTIVLKRGIRISGSVTLTKEHRKPTTLVLLDRRTDPFLFQWKAVHDIDRDWSQPKLENKKAFPSLDYIYQYRKQLSATSDFEFDNLQTGNYLLLAFYHDQMLMQKPIVLTSTDVAIESIIVPATGSAAGIVKEWNSILRNSNTWPFESSEVNPFEIYELRRINSPSPTHFRVDHLGAFRLDDLLSGQYSINLYKPPFRNYTLITTHPFLVTEGVTAQVDSDYAPILDIEVRNEVDSVRNNLSNMPMQADVIASNGVQTMGWLGGPEATRFGPRRRLYANRNLPSGRYRIQIPYGYSGTLHTIFNHVKTDRTEPKEVSAHEVSFSAQTRIKDESEQLNCAISKNGVVVFQSGIRAGSPMECLVEGAGPFDVLLENRSHGWALFRDVSFSHFHVELGNMEWAQGGNIELDISSTKFAVDSIRFELRNEMTGRSICFDEHDQTWKREKTFYEGLMPGAWVFDLFGCDSIGGEKLLLSKKIELKAGETILYDGGSIVSH